MNIPVSGGAVVLEPVGGDVASRLRKIGMALSTSDVESFHIAAAEGTMSCATDVVLPWHGADAVYGAPWVVVGIARGAERIFARADPGLWERRRQAARARVAPCEVDRVLGVWASLPVADRDSGAWAAPNGSAR